MVFGRDTLIAIRGSMGVQCELNQSINQSINQCVCFKNKKALTVRRNSQTGIGELLAYL